MRLLRGMCASRGLDRLPGSAKLTLEMGLVWALQGDFDRARTAFDKASLLDPYWSLPLLALGITDLQTGNADQAANVFRRAKQVAPNDYRCYYFHALALNRSQASQSDSARSQAIDELRQAVKLDPSHVQPRVALAQNQLSAGKLRRRKHSCGRRSGWILPNRPRFTNLRCFAGARAKKRKQIVFLLLFNL